MKAAPIGFLVVAVAILVSILGRRRWSVGSIDDESRRLAAFMLEPSVPAFLDFPKFRADPGRVEIVVEHDGVTRFDYAVVRHVGEANEKTLRIPCAVGPIGADCPVLSISRRNALATSSAPGLPDVAFESDMFDRELRVQCADARFAHALVDERMMEWLLLFPSNWGIQIAGGRALVFGNEGPQANQNEKAAETLADFLAHVPRALAGLYP